MLSGNWRSNIAVRIGVATLLTGLAIFSLEPNRLQQPNYPQADESRAEQYSRYGLEDVKGADAPVVSGQEPAPSDPKAQRNEWRQEEDLKAQWEQAKWAKYAVWAAIMSVVVTAIGVVFVALTLKATRDAVRETAKATSATERAVEVQVRIERPLLFVEQIDTNAGQGFVNFNIQNIGKSPAVLIEWSGQCEPIEPLPSTPVYSQVVKVRGTILRSNDDGMRIPIKLSDEAAQAIFDEQKTAYFWGYLRYEDVFGRTRTTGFAYVGHPYTVDGVDFDSRDGRGLFWARAGGKAYNYDREEDA